MKLLIFTDNHFCETSSIVRGFGVKYTVRLENQITSLNWLERLAEEQNCDGVICAGDFFDKPTLTDTELTALRDIEWSKIPHAFLVGNHESSVNGLRFNSAKALEGPGRSVISESKAIMAGDCEICFLPYIVESDRKPIFNYFGKKTSKRVIFSHNDIKGIQMGPIISQTGFELDDLSASADLVVNGHLHNGQKVAPNVSNLGNLTGQNFSEDAQRYAHNIMLLDTNTLEYELIENPHAFNFYKLEVKGHTDLAQLSKLKPNAVLSVSCKKGLLEDVQSEIARANVVESRVIAVQDPTEQATEADISDLTVDHIAKFVECAKAQLGESKILEEELSEICR